jgi:hypothetical protein
MEDNLKKDLIEQAEELGIDVDGRWSDQTLEKEIDKYLESIEDQENEDEPQSDTYLNISGRDHFIAGIRVKDGKQHTLTETDKKIDIFMGRLNRAVKLGMVKKV